jgi:hypothetical protein
MTTVVLAVETTDILRFISLPIFPHCHVLNEWENNNISDLKFNG